MDLMDQLTCLPYEYVQDTIFRKLFDTCVKYRHVLPEMESIEKAIGSADRKNYRELTIIIIDTLKTNAERSRVLREIFDNVTIDFQHGLDSKYPAHEGKYYINSIVDSY
jgi:hypothetical protein